MINKTCLILSFLLLASISFNSQADKPVEALIYHCGCVASNEFTEEANTGLLWELLIVNSNSKGHQNHTIGQQKTCTYFDKDSVEQESELVRGFNDCEVGDFLTGVSTCETEPVTGESCEQQQSICPCATNPEWDAFLESGNWDECGDGPFGVFTEFTRIQNTSIQPPEWAFSSLLFGVNRCGTVTTADGFIGFEGITAEGEMACAEEILAAASAVGNNCTAW